MELSGRPERRRNDIMTKGARIKIVLVLLALAVFSAVVFSIPALRIRRFWFAYGCGVFAILWQIYAIIATDGKQDTKDRFFGFPTARLGLCYLILQVSASILEIALFLPPWAVLVINVLLFAFPVIGVITTRTVRKEIARQEAKQKTAS